MVLLFLPMYCHLKYTELEMESCNYLQPLYLTMNSLKFSEFLFMDEVVEDLYMPISSNISCIEPCIRRPVILSGVSGNICEDAILKLACRFVQECPRCTASGFPPPTYLIESNYRTLSWIIRKTSERRTALLAKLIYS